MKAPETITTFAGVDARTETELPEWYEAQNDIAETMTFAEAIRNLPRATETRVAYENPFSGDGVETDRHNAVVEPDRFAAQASDENEHDPLFSVPTDSDTVINPVDVYGAFDGFPSGTLSLTRAVKRPTSPTTGHQRRSQSRLPSLTELSSKRLM